MLLFEKPGAKNKKPSQHDCYKMQQRNKQNERTRGFSSTAQYFLSPFSVFLHKSYTSSPVICLDPPPWPFLHLITINVRSPSALCFPLLCFYSTLQPSWKIFLSFKIVCSPLTGCTHTHISHQYTVTFMCKIMRLIHSK